MDANLECCAGLDIHQDSVVACFLSGVLDHKRSKEIETFGMTTKELLRLLATASSPSQYDLQTPESHRISATGDGGTGARDRIDADAVSV